MTKQDIDETVQSHKEEVVACYNAAWKRNKRLKGKIVTAFTISPDGDLVDIKIVKTTTIRDLPLQQCVLKKMSQWEFRASESLSEIVAYPFYLTPPG